MNNLQVSSKLKELKYRKLNEAYVKVMAMNSSEGRSFNELLLLMLSYEDNIKKTKNLNMLLKQTNLLQPTNLAAIEYDPSRGISKEVINNLKTLDFIKHSHNLIITGPTGCGKSFIGTAFGFEVCNSPYDVLYYRLPNLLQEINIKRDKGIYKTFMKRLKKTDLLILDDLGLANISIQESREILEILEVRNGMKSTILISQLPFEKWYEMFKDPTLADAIIDRIAYNSYKLELKGESMRKKKSSLPSPDCF
jgi:DNA replication protein DnaC